MQKNRVLILIVCLALLTVYLSGSVATATGPRQSDVVFRTPEEAVTAYLEGVAQADFQKIMQACAIDEMAQNFKFDLYIDRLRAFMPFQAPAPANSPVYVEMNKAQFTSQIAMQVRMLIYSLLSTEPVAEGRVIMMDLEKATAFVNSVDVKRLSGLQVKQIVLPNPEIMNADKYKDMSGKFAHVYGADESTERVALFSFENNNYLAGFTLLRYGDNWKISSQTSATANLSATGAVGKVPAQ